MWPAAFHPVLFAARALFLAPVPYAVPALTTLSLALSRAHDVTPCRSLSPLPVPADVGAHWTPATYCISMTHPLSIIVCQTLGRMMLPLGPTRSN